MSFQPITHLSSNPSQLLAMRSNSMYNISKGDSIGLQQTKQPIIPNNISFGKDTQAISYKSKPTILTQQSCIFQKDQISKMNAPASAQGLANLISPTTTTKSVNSSAKKVNTQHYSATSNTTTSTMAMYQNTLPCSSSNAATNSNSNSAHLFNNNNNSNIASSGNQQQNTAPSYSYNTCRARPQSQVIPFQNSNQPNNLIHHHFGDFPQRFSFAPNFEKKLSSQQAKENCDSFGGLNPSSLQSLKLMSTNTTIAGSASLSSNKLTSQQTQPSVIQNLPLKTNNNLQLSDGKKELSQQYPVLGLNQNIQNYASSTPAPSLTISTTAKNNSNVAPLSNYSSIQTKASGASTTHSVGQQINLKSLDFSNNGNVFPNNQNIKDSTIQFITNSDLETELKDLAVLLKKEREGSQMNTNNFLPTDREGLYQEMKLEIELLKEQNEVLISKVDELNKFTVEYEKEQQLVLLEKNLALKRYQDEIDNLSQRYTELLKDNQFLEEENKTQRMKMIEIQEDGCENVSVDVSEELEKKVLYMEEKLRNDEVQHNKLKLVILKQEESIQILENIAREAREAQSQAEQILSEEQTARAGRETTVSERIESYKQEINHLNKQINNLLADIEKFKNQKQEIEAAFVEFKAVEEEKINKIRKDMSKKMKELKKQNKTLENQFKLKEENLLKIEHEGLILSKNTNALSDKVLEQQSTLEKRAEEQRVNEKTIQEQEEQIQQMSIQLMNQRQSYELLVTQLQNQNKGVQEQLIRANSLLDSTSINFEVNSKGFLKDKEEAEGMITYLNEDIAKLRKNLEEKELIIQDLKFQLNESSASKDILFRQIENLRSDGNYKMKIFTEKEKQLSTLIDSLKEEKEGLIMNSVAKENQKTDQITMLFEQFQEEKLRLIQDNVQIVQEKIKLSEKIRDLQQSNIDLISKIHVTENAKNIEISQLKCEIYQLKMLKEPLK